MGEQKPEKTKKHICAGLLAHVVDGHCHIGGTSADKARLPNNISILSPLRPPINGKIVVQQQPSKEKNFFLHNGFLPYPSHTRWI